MNAQRFTQKSLESVQNAQNMAIEYQNMKIEEEHLLYALLSQDDGLIPQLLLKMSVDKAECWRKPEGKWRPFPRSQAQDVSPTRFTSQMKWTACWWKQRPRPST